MPFSSGQKIFALFFLISFIIAMIWAYRSDSKINKLHYKSVWLVLVSVIIVLASILILVRILH